MFPPFFFFVATFPASPASSWPGSQVSHIHSCVKSSNYSIDGLIQPSGLHQVPRRKLKQQQNQCVTTCRNNSGRHGVLQFSISIFIAYITIKTTTKKKNHYQHNALQRHFSNVHMAERASHYKFLCLLGRFQGHDVQGKTMPCLMESDKNVMPLRKPTTANSSPLKHQYVRRARHKHHANLCSRACLCNAVSVDIGPDPLAVLRPCNCTCGSGARRPRATGGRKNTAVLLTRPLRS